MAARRRLFATAGINRFRLINVVVAPTTNDRDRGDDDDHDDVRSAVKSGDISFKTVGCVSCM